MLSGIGIGFRREIAAELLSRPAAADFVEFVAEACTTPQARAEARAASELWPTALHGINLSLGSAEGVDPERARALGRLALELRACTITEHAAFVRAGQREIGHLTGLPFTKAAVGVLASNIARARRYLPDMPLLLENVARIFPWPDDAMPEGTFYAEVAQASGCELLLDVSNLYANAVNAQRDSLEELARFPLDRVAMLHIAGGIFEEGFWFDTHAHAVPDDVFALAEKILHVKGNVPIVLERDALFPSFDELESELRRLRTPMAVTRRASSVSRSERVGYGFEADRMRSYAAEIDPVGTNSLRDEQARLARALTAEHLGDDDAARFGRDDMIRSRKVLIRKRIDCALPLLKHLGSRRAEVVDLALARISEWPRACTLSRVTDAMRIAFAAAEQPHLADLAAMDALILKAQFVTGNDHDSVRPRAGPFVGRTPRENGYWVVKGFGPHAPVCVFRRRRSCRDRTATV